MNISSLKQIGRYQIEHALSEDEYTTIFQGFDPKLERSIIIKVLTHSIDYSTDFSDYFLREARALGQLSHANIVKLLDFGIDQGYLYLVMENIQGTPLSKILGQPIPWREAIENLIPVMQALVFAHEKNIIHRDLNPKNIYVTPDGRIVLSDFSIARIIETEETRDLTGTNVGLGSPEYMSPEQSKGFPLDYRADIYSLGVLFYEMVTGRPPFKAENSMEVIIQQVTMMPVPPSKYISNLPESVEEIILTALSKSPDERFQSVKEMLDALEIVKNGKSLPKKSSYRHRRKSISILIGSGVLILLAMVILAIFTFFPPSSPEKGNLRAGAVQSLVNTSMVKVQSATAVDATTAPVIVSVSPTPEIIENSALFKDSPLIEGANLPAVKEKISAGNISSMAEIARWGNPKLHQAVWNKNDSALMFASSSGIEFYASGTLTHQGVVDTQSWNFRIAVNKENMTYAVGLENGEIKLYDGKNGQEKGVLKGHSKQITALDFSPDGKYLASGSLDHTARIWDLEKNTELFKLTKHGLAVNTVVYSKDGKYIVTGSDDFRAIVWDAKTGELINDVRAKSMIRDLAISSDNRFITIGLNNATIQVWNMTTKQFENDFLDSSQVTGVTSLSLSPSDNLLATAGEDEKVRVWSVPSRTLLATYSAPLIPAIKTEYLDKVLDVSFSHDGTRLFSLTENGIAKVWDMATKEAVASVDLGVVTKNRLAFSPNDQYLAVQNKTNETRIISTQNGQLIVKHAASMPHGSNLFTIDSKNIALFSGKELALYSLTSDNTNSQKIFYGYPQNGVVSFLPDGKILAGSQYHQLVLWSTNNALKLSGDNSKLADNCQSAYAKNGDFIVSGSNLGIFINDARAQLMCKLTRNPRSTSSAYALDGSLIAFGLENGSALVWNAVKDSKPDEYLKLANGKLLSLAFSPDNTLMVTGGADGVIQIVDLQQKKIIQSIGAHTSGVTDVAFSNDGALISSCSADGTIRIWGIAK